MLLLLVKKILLKLCLHFARQDGQDRNKRKKNHATKATKITKTKRQKYGMKYQSQSRIYNFTCPKNRNDKTLQAAKLPSPIRLNSRRLLGSTNQACSSGFYLRIA